MGVWDDLSGIRGKLFRMAVLFVTIALLTDTFAEAKTVTLPLAQNRLAVKQRGARTVLTLASPKMHRSIILPADAMIAAGTFLNARLLGVSGRFAVIETTYASQTGVGGSQAQCAAGEEVIVRVVSTNYAFKQTDTLRIVSCWMNFYGDDPVWDAKTRELIVDRDADGARRYKLTATGGLQR